MMVVSVRPVPRSVTIFGITFLPFSMVADEECEVPDTFALPVENEKENEDPINDLEHPKRINLVRCLIGGLCALRSYPGVGI